MERRVSRVMNASLPPAARFLHWVASLLLFSVGYGWFFPPPERFGARLWEDGPA